nr:MAG TPA: hypothetical protein [Caudoviricetes sp.]
MLFDKPCFLKSFPSFRHIQPLLAKLGFLLSFCYLLFTLLITFECKDNISF